MNKRNQLLLTAIISVTTCFFVGTAMLILVLALFYGYAGYQFYHPEYPYFGNEFLIILFIAGAILWIVITILVTIIAWKRLGKKQNSNL